MRTRDAKAGVLHYEVRRRMLVNDLVSITLRNLEDRHQGAVGRVEQRLDLVWARPSIRSTRMSGIVYPPINGERTKQPAFRLTVAISQVADWYAALR
jgi:hypothetical protein